MTMRPSTFFITGETGTGKELMARMIHHHSRYAEGPFVAINCSNLPAELADRELFGSSPGAFTGALRKEQPGLWELASRGTLLLDEITEAPAAVLPKLLRVLQSGEFKRLGSKRSISVDVQVVAASNRDVTSEIKAGRFREDVYHRLSLYKLHLPPLRERVEDIPLLVAHFARRYSHRHVRFSQDALDLLQKHKWPGNVRELENIVRAAVTKSIDGTIYAIDLTSLIEAGSKSGSPSCEQCGGEKPAATDRSTEIIIPHGIAEAVALEERVKEFKLKTARETLACHHGNVTQAARALKISRPSLYRLLREPK